MEESNINGCLYLQITHILTVSAMGVPERAQIAGVEYKFLFVMDSITQNILANNLLSKLT